MGNYPRKSIGVLSRTTKDQWFRRMQNHLISEDLWEVVQNASSVTLSTPTSEIGSIPVINIEPKDVKANAKVTLHIQFCLDDMDEEDVAGMATAYEIWRFLVHKYKEKLQTTGRQYLADYMGYKKPADQSIQEAWTHLKKLGRKISDTQPDMKGLCRNDRLVQTLLASLPTEYMTTRDTLDAQGYLDVDIVLQRLQEKEASLKADETTMWAKREANRSRSRHQRRSASAESGSGRRQYKRKSSNDSRRCHICQSSRHFADDCPKRDKVREFLRRDRLKERAEKDRGPTSIRNTARTTRKITALQESLSLTTAAAPTPRKALARNLQLCQRRMSVRFLMTTGLPTLARPHT